jgi:outer membrane protein assembly factor BamB
MSDRPGSDDYVQRFDANGSASIKFALPPGRDMGDFAPAPYGELYVLATANRKDSTNTIVRFASDGTIIGERPLALSVLPTIAVFPSGELLVVDRRRDGEELLTVFRVLTSQGEVIKEVDDPLGPVPHSPLRFAVVGNDGNVYVVFGGTRPTLKPHIYVISSKGDLVSHCISDGPNEIDTSPMLRGVQVANGRALLSWGKMLHAVDAVSGATLITVPNPHSGLLARFDGDSAIVIEPVSGDKMKITSITVK